MQDRYDTKNKLLNRYRYAVPGVLICMAEQLASPFIIIQLFCCHFSIFLTFLYSKLCKGIHLLPVGTVALYSLAGIFFVCFHNWTPTCCCQSFSQLFSLLFFCTFITIIINIYYYFLHPRQSCKSWIAELDGHSEDNAKTYLGRWCWCTAVLLFIFAVAWDKYEVLSY